MPDSDKFYYTDGLAIFGPFDAATIRRYAAEGAINNATLIAAEGASEWVPFGQSDLAGPPKRRPVPPPLPEDPPAAHESVAQKATHAGEAAVKHSVRIGRKIGEFSGKVVGDIGQLREQILVPYFEIRSLAWLSDKALIGMVIVGLWPLICCQLLMRSDLLAAYWAIAFYFSAIWGIFFYGTIAPEQATVPKILACFFGTGIVAIPLLLSLYRIPPFGFLFSLTESHPFPVKVFGTFTSVAVPEEACKALVLILILHLSKNPLQPKTLLLYGLMSGLGFGIYEGVDYQKERNFLYSANAGQYYLRNLMRLTSLPFLHAIWTGIAGYFLALSALFPTRRHGLVAVAILIPACFHALHNTVGGVVGLTIDAVAVMTLLIYLSKSSEIEAALADTSSSKIEAAVTLPPPMIGHANDKRTDRQD